MKTSTEIEAPAVVSVADNSRRTTASALNASKPGAIAGLSETKDAFRETELHLRAALSAARIGVWRWDIASNQQLLDENLVGLLDLGPGQQVNTLDDFLQWIHCDDRAEVARAFRNSAEFCDGIEVEFKVQGQSANTRWLKFQGDTARNEDGRPLWLTGIGIDITDVKQLEHALREADHRKDEFLAMLGHELRNPLASIKGGVQLLQSPKVKESTRANALPIVAMQVTHMERLIEDIFDVASIIHGKVGVRPETFDLMVSVEEAISMTHDSADTKHCQITLHAPRYVVKIYADPVRMTQVFLNILSNAIRYSAEESNVEVTVQAIENDAVVSIHDFGMGIDPERLPYIFDLFDQSNHSPGQSEGGLGMGLTVARKLVEMQGGRIEAFSHGLHKGSEFRVYFPLKERYW
jgi:signal transduction histidine kinase